MTIIMRIALICMATLWLAPQATAQGASYLNEAVQALQSGDVYVSAAVTDIDAATKEQLAKEASSSHVAVVALPGDAASEAGGDPAQFAANIATQSGDSTIVVSIGGDLVAVSSTLGEGVAPKLVNQAESDSGSTGEALLNFITEVRETKSGPSGSQPSADGGGGFGMFAVIALVVIAAGSGGVIFRNRQRNKRPKRASVPKDVRELLSEVETAGARIEDPAIRHNLPKVVDNTERLFWRLHDEPDRARDLAKVYVAHLTNLLGILIEFRDIERYKEDYERADVRLEYSRESVQNYVDGSQLNIQEVTSGTWTNFDLRAEQLWEMNPAKKSFYRSSREQR